MSQDIFSEMRADCIMSSVHDPNICAGLTHQHIALTGGTGFLGTWIAEMIAAINDKHQLGITLDIFSRNTREWARKYQHLANRPDIRIQSQDVRSPFYFSKNTSYVIHAAGVPNNRVHASDPLRVHQTTVMGLNNSLDAASKLDNLHRFINVSSCLVVGPPINPGPVYEQDANPIPAGQLHNVYVDAKRSAESLAAIYRSQFRLPISTLRPFTLTGAYQELDRPWAINNFLRDVITGNEIRIHGDGSARRSYLYGSDAAWWTLASLVHGVDGEIYNLGSINPISHLELAGLICKYLSNRPSISINTSKLKRSNQDDLFPDTKGTEKILQVGQTVSIDQAIDKTYRWLSRPYRII